MSVGSKWVKVHGGGMVAVGVPPSQGGGPLPSYPILNLLPTASPMEAGPNPSRPWPWGPAPQHLGTPTPSLGSACLASRSSTFQKNSQVSTAGSPKLALPAWHPSDPPMLLGAVGHGGGCPSRKGECLGIEKVMDGGLQLCPADLGVSCP